jgi:hypothetical protein
VNDLRVEVIPVTEIAAEPIGNGLRLHSHERCSQNKVVNRRIIYYSLVLVNKSRVSISRFRYGKARLT